MSRRAIQTVRPFAFQSDFSSDHAEENGEERLSLSARELATLFAEARAEGAAAMAEHQSGGDAARLAESTEKLNAALADLVELARHLESTASDPTTAHEARRLINRAASRIIDGQGDLFSKATEEGA